MDLHKIARTANYLRSARNKAEDQQTELYFAIDTACAQQFGNSKKLAQAIGVTEQYLCDLRRGRRRVSENVLDRIIRLGGDK